MTLTNAPAVVTSFANMIVACASWTPGLAGLFYPTEDNTATGIIGVISASPTTRTPYAAGCAGLPSGNLLLVIYHTGDIGQTESFAMTIVNELQAQTTGLALRGGVTALASIPGDAKAADGFTRNAINVEFEYGLKG
jgi:hypothetical protein